VSGPDRYSSRRHHLHEWRRDSLWLWPAVAAAGAWCLAAAVVAFTPASVDRGHLVSSNLDDARTLLGTVASSILTFTGVVFSITLVALQMASTQYSPRVLRNYVRKPITKLALSTFIATFVYSLSVLARIGTTSGGHTRAPEVAVGLSYVLVMACLFVFIAYVHSTVRSIRVTYIIEDVYRETLRSLDQTFPARAAGSDTAADTAAELGPVTGTVAFDHPSGVLDGIQTDRLVRLARHHDSRLVLVPEPGTYLVRGVPVVEVHGGDPPSPDELLAALDISPARTLYQDARYGMRQLVDIAARALSPAVNDPTTALQVIDRLQGLLAVVAVRPQPSGIHADEDGVVRLVVTAPTWERMMDLAFTEIATYGAGAPQVSRKLLSVYATLDTVADGDRSAVVARHRAWLVGEVGRLTPDPGARDRALTPDALGLG
jgi:uncharacterized membrane protein